MDRKTMARCVKFKVPISLHRLLKEGKNHTRNAVAEAFVRSGTTFIKGPFRMANFTIEERAELPTNGELARCAHRLGIEAIYE